MSQAKTKPFIQIERISMHSLSKYQLIHPEIDSNHQLPYCVVCGKKPNFGNHKDFFRIAKLIQADKEEVILDFCCNQEECLQKFGPAALAKKIARLKEERKRIQKSIKLIEKNSTDIEIITCPIQTHNPD